MRLQIIDPSEVFCSMLKELLPRTFEIDICLDGASAISRINRFQPEILVLSANLPGGDGFYILQTIKSAGLSPKVLMFTPLISDYVAERVVELKIDHIMCRPCDVRAVADCICKFRDKLMGGNTSVESHARNLLLSMGFHTNLCGYRYLLSSLCLLWENPGQSLTKELYPAVAKLHKGSWQQIEHGIRLSITNAWERRTGNGWELYFTDAETKPTNSVFLTRLAQCVPDIDKIAESI